MPEVLSPTVLDKHTNADMTSDHDFLGQISYSPKQDSDCNLSDLSSSFWSAKISQKLYFKIAHEEHKLLFNWLDLNNLPLDSDDENAVDKKNIVKKEISPHDVFLEE